MTKQKPPTQSAKRRTWSYKAGEKGRNRVRVFAWAEQGEGLWIDYREDGKRIRKPLGHSDQQRAKQQADAIAGRTSAGTAQPAVVEVITLRTLFDMYSDEVSAHKKSASARGHDARTLPLLLKAFGAGRKPDTLNVRDWQSYIRRRQSGELAPQSKREEGGKSVLTPVRARVIEQDLKLLLAVLNWAERARADGSGYLLDRNPLRGLKVPKEESPRRPMFTAEQCTALRRGAAKHSPLAERFVVLAYYTGHRSSAIRQLRWSDVDVVVGTIRWRGEIDKIGHEHRTPMHPELMAFLKGEQKRMKAIGDAWVFPHPYDAKKPLSREYAVKELWPALRDAAKIPQGQRYGWHSFRRTWANQLRGVPLKELQTLGGWKSAQTIVQVYLQPDEGAQRAALARLPATGSR